ncbi:OmpP1/FadL family transporter [Rhodobacter ferrooxidans]|uniref:Membrane protein involved in aromatic hydrocarbon degradation n=1 Tax=Rhodobacter ferrooxidans TaxID=371731 RepID=C8RYZ9_9RHOB|nr:outer membrane protein transport protein [Rhodobacter sp. SW2]EEW25956.1 membrane protein involved in aromatic hydrocarbon degradation [Rhodobacter sp. SW2]
MKKTVATLGVLAISAGAATAGGIDRSGQFMGVLFEKGNYAELSFGSVSPDVSGVATVFSPTSGAASGDMSKSYAQIGGALKFKINDSLDAALIFDQPFGADVSYPAGSGYYAQGTTADLNTSAITGVLKYRLPSNISVYGGLRYQTFEAKASIPFVGGYTVNGAKDDAVGYLVGVAYEKPEIALRVALTYNSKIRHSLATTEFGGPSPKTDIDTPQSVNLEFQSGIAKDTLLFGSVRWVDWTAFDISPATYGVITGNPLVSYHKDTVSYALGIGRKFSENWSAAVSVGYETKMGKFSTNLGPTDGKTSITLGATYTRDNMKISGGVTYVDIGNAQPTLNGTLPSANFRDNHAVGFGLKVGFSF